MTLAMLEPNETWVAHWRCGIDEEREREVSFQLLMVFRDFWHGAVLAEKAPTTRRRYSGGLHALGGYLVKRAVDPEWSHMTAMYLLWDALAGGYDGPLVHHYNEAWQRELDTVCRKLYKYLSSVAVDPTESDGTLGS